MHRKRAMIMIFVVILIAAATTIIAASVDLGRMAAYKQHQSEREAKWQYCVESAENFVIENMIALQGATQSFNKTVNGIDLTIGAAPDLSWNRYTGTQISVTGTIEGKSKSTSVYAGKRATVQPPQFALFVSSKFLPTANVDVLGDAYMAGTINASTLSITGDIYCDAATAPSVNWQSGAYIGRQPDITIPFDNAAYFAQATVKTSGTITLNNPTNLLSLTNSELRYHTGALTITGTTLGEITIYVNGTVILDNVKNSLSLLGRLVVICNGDVTVRKGTSQVFVICSGQVLTQNGGRDHIIVGSVSGAELRNDNDLGIQFDNYFVTNTNGGTRYWLPGQW